MASVFRILIVTIATWLGVTAARAHPHVWVTVHSEVVYAPDGRAGGVRHHWTFDESFSSFAVQNLESDGKGGFTARALAPLAQINIESLKESGYFTFATVDGRKISMSDPVPDYLLTYAAPHLTLHFTLPFKTPVKAKTLRVEIYDPTIFVDLTFAKDTPVRLIGAPAPCTLQVQRPQGISTAQSTTLGEAFFNALSASSNWGERFANRIEVKCP